MSLGVTNEIREIVPDFNAVAPAQMAAVFNHTAPPEPDKAAPVKAIANENDGRAANAEQVMKQAGASLKELDKAFAQAAPDQSRPSIESSIATRVASAGVKLAETAASIVMTAGGGTMATMGMSGSTFRAISKAASKAEAHREMRNDSDYGYGATPSMPEVHSYGGPQPVSMPRAFGTAADITGFRGGAIRMAAIYGGPDLLPEIEMTSYGLQSMEVLRLGLEQQQELAVASMNNARTIRFNLDQRAEKGVATSANTIEYALAQDTPENVQRDVTYGV